MLTQQELYGYASYFCEMADTLRQHEVAYCPVSEVQLI
jgi:hypothetical protein